MEDTKYSLNGSVNLALSSQDADKLISLSDGTSALLYLYALRGGGCFTADGAAKALRRTPSEIAAAAEKLRAAGLFSGGEKKDLCPPAHELPQYPAKEITSTAATDKEFQAVIDEMQRIFGKILTGAEINTIFGLYSDLRLPPEVIILLINYCVTETRERLGQGHLPSVRTIEKEGYVWFNAEVLTLERAEEFLQRRREKKDRTNVIKRVLQINDRQLSPTESKYISAWIDMGFDDEAIGEAYDRTVVKTGKLQWKYMSSILSSWNEKGLHTLDEIERGDGRRGSQKPVPAGQPANAGAPVSETDRVRAMMEKL